MLLIVLATLFVGALAEEAETQTRSAYLVASKMPLSTYAVENMDLVMEYGIYNVGDKPATKVTLDDRHSFPTQSFEIVKGLLNVRFERIPGQSNVTHSVIIRPRAFGMFNYTAAHVTYYVDDESEPRTGYTNAPGEGYIYRQREYERRFSPKYMYWIVFFGIVAPTTIGSYYIFSKSKAKYAEYAKKPKNA